MDIATLSVLGGLMIPISAIVGGYWQNIVKRTQQHREEMARIQATQHTSLDAHSHVQLTALRQELAALRDTTTQYDISVERNMHEIMQRLQAVEARTTERAGDTTAQAAPPVPRIDYNREVNTQRSEEMPVRLQAGS